MHQNNLKMSPKNKIPSKSTCNHRFGASEPSGINEKQSMMSPKARKSPHQYNALTAHTYTCTQYPSGIILRELA